MLKTWTGSKEEAGQLARELEAHLNEFASEVISVSYAVAQQHYVLAVYKPLDVEEGPSQLAVTAAEQIIDEAQA